MAFTKVSRRELKELLKEVEVVKPVEQPAAIKPVEVKVEAKPVEEVKPEPPKEQLPRDPGPPPKSYHNPENKKKREYSGDLIDNTPPPDGRFEALEFETSTEMASFFMQDINTGATKLYPWQISVNNELSLAKATAKEPYEFSLCACNGSGKDAFVVTLFAVWFCASKIKSRTIITSSSGTQLSSQTEAYIKAYCTKINEYMSENFGGPIFKINQRFIKGIRSGSEIRLFATDEEGKAEGYHPIEPGAEMCIIVNEAKSVSAEIYRALGRCTGYNYWLDISSPGQPLGDFYDRHCLAEHKLVVDYRLCGHHSDKQRLKDLSLLTEDNPYYRSKWLALFTSIESSSVIPHELVVQIRRLSLEGKIPKVGEKKRTGIDLAGGGDENSLTCCKGNSIWKRVDFRDKDTTISARRIDHILEYDFGLTKDDDSIFADDGAVGKAIIDMLVNDYSWNIKRQNNQSPAADKRMFLNKGAQNWYRARRILDSKKFNLSINDDLFYKQLSNRWCSQEGHQGRLGLEPKPKAKANGRPSPDRADSFILALTGCLDEDFDALDGKASTTEGRPKQLIAPTLEAMEEWMNKQQDLEYEGKLPNRAPYSGNNPKGSLSVLLGQQNRKPFGKFN